jgi:Putative DNA-binding domain
MLKLDTLADLQALCTHQVPESNTLEYKASPAVENTDPRKLEMSKDISAMANAEGGQFVYAMTEANHLPAGLDAGINPTKFNGLWFEQVIQQNIKPLIEDLKIRQKQLGNGNVATVIDVPKSRTVHQAKDGRYYRRRNFRNDIMEDYEIREALNRATKPELYLRMGLAEDPTTVTLPVEASGITMPFGIHASIGNKSSQPSFYTVFTYSQTPDFKAEHPISKQDRPRKRIQELQSTGG